MKPMQIFLRSAMFKFVLTTLAAAALNVAALGQATKSVSTTSAPQAQQPEPTATISSMVDREISDVEKQVIDAAEAKPEEKFNFSPEKPDHPRRRLQRRAHLCRAGKTYCSLELFSLVDAYGG